jgi:chromosome segregation ATPase
MRLHCLTSALAVTIIVSLAGIAAGQEPTKQEGGAKPRSVRPSQKPSIEPPQTPAPDRAEVPPPEQILALKMNELGLQIEKLTTELRRLRKETEHNGTSMELMLYEERLSKVESKLDDLTAYKSQLEAREQDVQRRTRNIQQEMILRAGNILRRDEAEAAIRAELGRSLDDTRMQKETNQQRINDLQSQAEYLRKRIEILRKKIEQLETRSESPNQ